MTDTVAGRYAVGQKIGSGGMGDVFRGLDQRSNSPVAIKVLKAELATDAMITRFRREGEALRQLNHPNIVTLLDAVQENEQYYLIMELVEGGALDDLLRRIPRLPVEQILNITLDVTDALTRAHRLSIIHRDIKPANILLAKDGMPRLTDFGIARIIGSEITETGSIMGTAAYIAPEVIQGAPADARSDIWALGIVLFEMLAGRQPFQAENAGSLIFSIISNPLPDLETLRPDVPTALIDLINRMLMKDPAERIPRMRLVGAELEAILASDDRLTDSLDSNPTRRFTLDASSGAYSTTPSPVRSNLPAQTTPFVGRENELAELKKLISDSANRLVTILAPGGMGKTRLALELARQFLHHTQSKLLFENGVYFVDLTPLTSPEHIVQTTAEAVGCAFQQDGRSAMQQLLDYLREKNLLLLMDNFEHVLDGRSVVQELLQTAPGVKFLATSREKLNLNAESVFILSGMDFPTWESPEDALEYSAVKLFMQSARRARSDFQLQAEDLPVIARICRQVQGTPLGILLAAAWLETLSPGEIEQEISRSLDFLESEMHDLPERHRSLRAVFEYSWNLLAESERELFARVSVFHGGFTREAVQHILGANLRTLALMVNKSLLRRDTTSGRYEIHELLRQYAEDKFHQFPDMTAIYDTHSRYYLGLITQQTPRLKGQGQLEAIDIIETDFENIRAAWKWAVQQGSAEAVQAAIEPLYLFLITRNRFMDGEELFGAARQVWKADSENPPLLAGQVLVRFPEGAPLSQYRRGLHIAEQHHDAFEIAFCQRLIGHWLSHSEFNQDEGIPLLHASLGGFQAIGNKFCTAQVLDDLGWSYNLIGNREQQVIHVQQSLKLRREIGDKFGTANALRNMGGSSGGFYESAGVAFNYWQEAKDLCYQLNDRLGVAWNASLQAATLVYQGKFEQATAFLDEADPHARDINDPVVKGFIQAIRAIILALRDEGYQQARQLLEAAYPPDSEPGFLMTIVPFGIGITACGLNDFSILRPYFDIYSRARMFREEAFYVPLFLPCRIVILAQAGQHERAAELLQALLASSISYVGLPFPTGWLERWGLFTRLRTQLEESLGTAVFQAAWERGGQLGVEDMVQEFRAFLNSERSP
jgi:serine/threonine protein kinase